MGFVVGFPIASARSAAVTMIWLRSGAASRWCAMACLVMAVDCSGAPEMPHNISSAQVAGSWLLASDAGSRPGLTLGWTLRDSSGSLVGAGTWSGEAGPSGALFVRGSVVNDSIQLGLIFSYDLPVVRDNADFGRFAGMLITLDQMSGTLVRQGSSPQPVILTRVPPR